MQHCLALTPANSGVRDGHLNRKSQKSLRFRCAKSFEKLRRTRLEGHVLSQGKVLNLSIKSRLSLGAKKNPNKFRRPLWGNRPRDEPPPVPGTNGTKWRFYCGIQQKKAGLSQERVPICPGEGSRLSQGRFLFVPDTVLHKLFMFIGFFSCPIHFLLHNA